MNYDKKITGQTIGMLRTRKGLSQEALSGLAGVSRSHLALIENGVKSTKVETLWRIADAMGMRMSDLVRIIEKRSEQGHE